MTTTSPLVVIGASVRPARGRPAKVITTGLREVAALDGVEPGLTDAIEAALCEELPEFRRRMELQAHYLAKFDELSERAVEKLKRDFPGLFDG